MNKTPIIKVVGTACNLRCDYCFFLEHSQKKVISLELLESFFEQYFQMFSGEINFVWHGGEPLLAGIDFYQIAISLQRHFKKNGDKIRNSIQTNATLITENWCEFFKEHKFAVGVSLDGTEISHNRHRKFVDGHGSFQATMAGIQKLQDHQIKFGIIATVTKSSLENLEHDLEFFVRETKLDRLAFNLFADDSTGNQQLTDENISSVEAEFFYQTIMRFWLKENNRKLSIREIDNCLAGVVGKWPKNCSFNGSCTDYFSLNIDGEVYPCERLSFNGSGLLGDLRSQTLVEILTSKQFDQHCQRSAERSVACEKCSNSKFCNNGCTALRNKDGIFRYCSARQLAYQKLSALIQKLDKK
jgi:uncharacterized protein